MHKIFVGGKMTLKLLLLSAIFFNPALLAVRIVEMEVTAYCGCKSCCGEYSDGITASGYIIRQGDKLIAAPRTLPFGTVILIPGYGRAAVKDRGGAIKGNRLDVYFSTHQEALEWGRQTLQVQIWEK